MNKRWGFGVGGILLLVMTLLSACTGGGKEVSGSAGKEPLKIGAIFSMTGPNSPLGVPEKQAVEMQVKKINGAGGIDGRKIELVIEDDKSDNTEAVKAIRKLKKNDNVVAVLGSSGSGPSLGMVEYASSEKLPLISMAAADQITNPVRQGIFKTPHTDIHGTKRIYQFLKEKGWNKVAILYDSNTYGSGWAKQLKKYAAEYGLTLVADEKYGTKDPSMSTQLTKIKNSGASVLIVAGTNPAPATIMKEAKQLGLTLPIVSSHGSANAKFIDLAGGAAEGIYMVAGKLLVPDQLKADDPQTSVIKEFIADYQKAYTSIPDGFAGYGYDGLNLLVQALKQANGDPTKVGDTLEKVNYTGVTGQFTFSKEDHTGLKEDSMVILQVKEGKYQLVK